jgi:hypothetical protein
MIFSPNGNLIEERTCRHPATDVKFIDRGKIFNGDSFRPLPQPLNTGTYCAEEIAPRVMIRNQV